MLFYFFFILFLNMNYAYIPNLLNLKLKVIEYSSNILPKIDVFGHKILEENKLLIEKIIHIDNLSIELKKELILSIIKFTEVGDSFGNFVLTNYEHLVNNLL